MGTEKDRLQQLSTLRRRIGENPSQKASSRTRLHFVHASHPDEFKSKSTQSRIRYHVMTAEGRKRRKLPRFIPLSVKVTPDDAPVGPVPPFSHLSQSIDVDRDTPAFSKFVPRSLIFHGALPIEPNPRARQLIHFMHTEGDNVFRPFRYEWHAIALVDYSAFHLYLANAALFLCQVSNKGRNEYGDCAEAARYFGACLHQVTRRLEDQWDSVSSGLITTILGLLCYNVCRGSWDTTQVHMKALERIIQLRGGLHGLESNVQFFIMWFDVLMSSFYDTLPRFAQPSQISDNPLYRDALAPHLQTILRRLRDSERLREIANCVEGVACLASYVNSNSEGPHFWRNSVKAAKLIIPISHSLLSLPRYPDISKVVEQHPTGLLGELVRVALLAQLASLKREFSLPSDELAALQNRFTALLTLGRTQFPDVELWAVVSMALSINNQRESHVQVISQLMKGMGIRSAEDVINNIKHIVWIERVSSQNSRALEAEVDEEYTRQDLL